MSYPNHWLQPIPQYYPNSPYESHIQPPPPRPETSSRKRPKYTRSKTGCLTCRVKKIKCDETKPSCMRCSHGSRECTWPEGVPMRKKSTTKKDSIDRRPSTAGSSGLSDASTPPTREHTPPRRPQLDMNILPPLRSSSDNFVHLQASSDHISIRRQTERGSVYIPQLESSNLNMLSATPESSCSSRYDHTSLHHPHSNQSSRHTTSGSYRTLSHQPSNHWNPLSEVLSPYYQGGAHERAILGHSPQYDHSNNRYQ